MPPPTLSGSEGKSDEQNRADFQEARTAGGGVDPEAPVPVQVIGVAASLEELDEGSLRLQAEGHLV